jgi:general secretion pathway protein H
VRYAGAPSTNPDRPSARGFTLLEVLVVVVIIAVLTTIGVLSIGVLGGDRQLETEVERYTDVLAAAAEQAQLEGRDYGIHFTDDAYQIFVYAVGRQRWELLGDDRLYAEHRVPKGIAMTLQVEARTVLLATPSPDLLAAPTPDAMPAPQIVLYGSGDADPYVLSFLREGETQTRAWVLDGAADGTVKITKPAASP